MAEYNITHVHDPSSRHTYRLRRYLWRSLLTVSGPLIALGLYTYICVYFLLRPPVNDVVLSSHFDGNWIFYAWFLISIFMFDWARIGLANIEACALMYPQSAPSTAMQLMWHSDGNWANALWWLRAVRSAVCRSIFTRSNKTGFPHSTPGGLWILLSCVMLFLFAAIPLSGLSIQTAQVQCGSGQLASIYGPQKEDFGLLPAEASDFAQRIHLAWQSGRQTTPQGGGILYAPLSAENASTTYFDDQALLYSTNIETFAGPAVREAVTGRAWGIWANVSCNPAPIDQLQMIRTHDYNNYSINYCSSDSLDDCDFRWRNPSQSALEPNVIVVPSYFNETAYDRIDSVNYSIMAAADGYFENSNYLDNGPKLFSPYFFDQNHDNCTMDHFRGRPQGSITTAAIELYIWESRWMNLRANDPVMQSFIDNSSNEVQIIYIEGERATAQEGEKVPWAGFGVHCDVTTAVGHATVDPAHRQFSSFVRLGADSYINQPNTSFSSPYLYPAQRQALLSIQSNAYSKLLASNGDPNTDEWSLLSLWRVIQQSIGSPRVYLNLGAGETSNFPTQVYPLLTPSGLQKSMYKLLGESLIALMDERSDWNGRHGELHQLRRTTYIIAGIVPWQCVLALLAIWALITSGAGLWMIIYAEPRWAPTLSGFEMFKFGARYADEVDNFAEVDFQGCSDALQRIPGMVGLLPGTNSRSTDRPHKRLPYLIGLSEVSLGPDLQNRRTEFTFDQKEAATTKYG